MLSEIGTMARSPSMGDGQHVEAAHDDRVLHTNSGRCGACAFAGACPRHVADAIAIAITTAVGMDSQHRRRQTHKRCL